MDANNNHKWEIEVLKCFKERGRFRSVLFDFDGTISLIRQGWQEVMKPYFCKVLRETPMAEDDKSIENCVHDFVDFNTGKQTIYQCLQLAEEVRLRGGKPLEAQEYKDEYHHRLLERIQYRLDGLKSGGLDPRDFVVPGSFELLEELTERGLTLYLASGTDEGYVLNEAQLLGVTGYFNGGIFGARKEYKLFSKKMIVNNIIETHKLQGNELLGFGDGYVEIENIKEVGGLGAGVASNELTRCGIDEWKRNRLIKAGADIIIPDFSETKTLIEYLFPEVNSYAL